MERYDSRARVPTHSVFDVIPTFMNIDCNLYIRMRFVSSSVVEEQRSNAGKQMREQRFL